MRTASGTGFADVGLGLGTRLGSLEKWGLQKTMILILLLSEGLPGTMDEHV